MNQVDPIWATIEVAPKVETLGYSRYWLAEHHSANVAHSSPELLVPVVAGVTHRIRVGVAGVLLRFYSPFKIAKDFRLLHALYPRRIDLGLARGTVPDEIHKLLTDTEPAELNYRKKVSDLLAYLRGTGECIANPGGIAPPEVWMLGSSLKSMTLAASLGTAFCLSLFATEGLPKDPEDIIKRYRDQFSPSPELQEPKWSIAVAGVCADTEKKARDTVDGAGKDVFSALVGNSEQCKQILFELSERYHANEFIYLDQCQRVADRVHSYNLLSSALNLKSDEPT